MSETEYIRKYGGIDFAPARKAKPPEPMFTAAEREEMRQSSARRAQLEADAPYLGRPPKKPLHPDPFVCEIAEMLLKEFDL